MPLYQRFSAWRYLLIIILGSFQGQAQPYPFPTTPTKLQLHPVRISEHSTTSYFGEVAGYIPTDTIIYVCFNRVDKAVLFRQEGDRWEKTDSTGEILSITGISPDRQTMHLMLKPGSKTSFRLDISNHFEQQYRPEATLLNSQDYPPFRVKQLISQTQEKTRQSLFIGMLLMMFIYAFIQALLHTTAMHTWYAVYVGSVLCVFLLRFEIVVPEQFGFGKTVNFVGKYSISFLPLGVIAYFQFIQAFSAIRNRTVKRLIYWFVFPMNIVVAIVDLFYTAQKYTDNQLFIFFKANEVVDTLVFIFTFYWLVKQKSNDQKLLLAGVCTLFIGGLVQQGFIWHLQDRVLYRPWINSSREVSILIELSFFLAALSTRNRRIEHDKLVVQAQFIEQLKENEQKQTKLNGLRDEIARDLHDEMGSQLSSISILSQTIARFVTDERAQSRLSTIGQTARQAMDSMREIVWSLSSSSDSLQHIGLRIRETAYALFNDTPVRLHTDIGELNASLGLRENQRRDLNLIAKECLTNVFRHAHAQNVWLTVQVNSTSLVLIIRDDGLGFDSTTDVSGLGMKSIHQRVIALCAVLHIDSKPGGGTTIRVECPIQTSRSVTTDYEAVAPNPY